MALCRHSFPIYGFHGLRYPQRMNLVYQEHPIRRESFSTDRMQYYQLAFFTPGIRPAEAISRNWIRLTPNSRI